MLYLLLDCKMVAYFLLHHRMVKGHYQVLLSLWPTSVAFANGRYPDTPQLKSSLKRSSIALPLWGTSNLCTIIQKAEDLGSEIRT